MLLAGATPDDDLTLYAPDGGASLLLPALWLAVSAGADDFKPSYLQLTQTAPDRYEVLWKVPALDERTVLKLQPVLPAGTRELAPRRSAFAAGATAVRWTAEVKGGLEGKPITFEGLDVTRTDILTYYYDLLPD